MSSPPPLPPALQPPPDPAAHPAWLAWLDANGLTPLAASAILEHDALPLPTRAHLAAAYSVTQAHWQQRQAELLAVLDLLAAEPALPVILLKGVALALTLYPDPALRPMGDLDLLVPASSLALAVDRLQERGYKAYTLELAPGFNDVHLHHVGLFSSDANPSIHIEVHRTLPRLPQRHETMAMAWFWAHTETSRFQERDIQVFNPTAQLLHLSMHLARQHRGSDLKLIWLHDIDLLWRSRGPEIDWGDLLAMAQTLAWDAALQRALSLAVDSFHTPLPVAVCDWLGQDPRRLGGYGSIQRLAATDLTRMSGAFESLHGRPLHSKLHVIARHLVPQPAYMRWRYRPKHPALLPLTYPYRWLDIAVDLARTLGRSVRQRRRGAPPAPGPK